MKGVLLAGGLGKRLAPLTKTDNKHYLPVFDKRMIELPLATLRQLGCTEVLIVLGGNDAGRFVDLLGSGGENPRVFYTYQDGYGGIPDALKCAREFLGGEQKFPVILGDNYFEVPPILPESSKSATIYLQTVKEPWHFGIAELDKQNNIQEIHEKPENPKSRLAILGMYWFTDSVWDKIDELKTSARGETEVIDILKAYMKEERLKWKPYSYFWHDMGTFENWMKVSNRLKGEQ